MSAIAGLYYKNKQPVPIDMQQRVMKALERFPADRIGLWQYGALFFGCHAQWCTPESVAERLPFYDAARRCAITADAVIDNRLELVERLSVAKDKRTVITDSEIILLAYYKWGENLPHYLMGDFAFMIWDEREQKLFGARDFSGRRTLYFVNDNDHFAFSTTLSPLLQLPFVAQQMSANWIAEFLTIPDMYEVADPMLTVYEQVKQLPPSHAIKVTQQQISLSRYCLVSGSQGLKLKSNEEYEEAFREVYQRAIRDRLRTYKPVGAQLSGGLDSGSVVGFAAPMLKEQKKCLHTFSYVPINGFEDWTPKRRVADERPYIHSTIRYVGNINAHFCDFAGRSSFNEIDDWLEIMEMPYKFFENSFWIKGIYEEAQKYNIGILLNGKIGNFSISWGPALDVYADLLKRMKWVRVYRECALYAQNTGVGRKRILKSIGKKAFPFPRHKSSAQGDEGFPSIINAALAKQTDVLNRLKERQINLEHADRQNAIDRRLQQFQHPHFLSIGSTGDTKLSLRHGIYDRDPTNDLRVIRFCLGLPVEQYVQNGRDRALIRRATHHYLPDHVRLNQKVRGIQGADAIQRMRDTWPALLGELQSMSRSPLVADVLDQQAIQNILQRIEEPKPHYVFAPDFKMMMRSLILFRFIKKIDEGR
ncbi:hypothetical protein GCM10011391_06240 [Pullulanibacillus camelliae]|uniref:asparagine synthase (glutamine-hydrolyzing) n=1 Tax=Pullulanibacillus camelliae TaxID=1707096 RepID=A0A8J2VN99_9BACL|nr:asparagine synthase-related protein [Pullulanibacillus camelliae]GGE30378.1 hypothetical protein GCM10011391_06240 [Pullulanibacillus camelliae]